MFDEYEAVAAELQVRFSACDSRGALDWIHQKAVWIEPGPLGTQRSRDLTDDVFIACAVSASAKYLVSWDKDLLVMGKPFGVDILTPARFLTRVRESRGAMV